MTLFLARQLPKLHNFFEYFKLKRFSDFSIYNEQENIEFLQHETLLYVI